MKVKGITCLLMSLFVIVTTQTTLANSVLQEELNDGLYVGGDIGWLTMRATVNHTLNWPGTNLAISQAVASDGVFGDLHLGAGKKIRRLYLGLEFYGTLNSGKDAGSILGIYGDTPLHVAYQFRSQGSVGVDVLPGFYPTNNVRSFVHIGFLENSFQVSANTGINKTKWLPGMRLGVGSEVALTEHFSLRTDWTYNFYRSWTPVNLSALTLKFGPYTYTGTVGINYLF